MDKGPITIQPKQSVEEVFEEILRTDLAHINKWTPVALLGMDIEGVHQIRVGLRRMRSTLNLFTPAIPHKNTKILAAEMRWAARQLDRARDLDVYIADNLSSKKAKKDKKKKLLRKVALKHRQKAYKKVRRFLKGRRYSSFNNMLARWLDKKKWREGLSKAQKKNLSLEVTYFANQVLDDHHGRVVNAGRNIGRLDDKALHRLRIECKKLRYANEFFSPLYGKKMAIFSKQLEQLQDVLGLLHDRFVMEGLQSSLLKGKKSKKLAAIADKLMDERNKSAADQRDVLNESWQRFRATGLPWLQ